MRIDRVKLATELAKKDWSVQELAKESGVSRATVSYIKNGKSCSAVTAIRLAEALGVEVMDILED